MPVRIEGRSAANRSPQTDCQPALDQTGFPGARLSVHQETVARKYPVVQLFDFGISAEKNLRILFGIRIQKFKRFSWWHGSFLPPRQRRKDAKKMNSGLCKILVVLLQHLITHRAVGVANVGIGDQIVLQPLTATEHQIIQVQIPEFDRTILASRGEQRAVRTKFDAPHNIIMSSQGKASSWPVDNIPEFDDIGIASRREQEWPSGLKRDSLHLISMSVATVMIPLTVDHLPKYDRTILACQKASSVPSGLNLDARNFN